LPRPRVISPSYYKLGDGTILRAHVNLNYALADPRQPDGFTANTTNTTICYVPADKRRPDLFTNYDPSELASGIVNPDVDCDVLSENFSVYDLSNGIVLSIKTVVGQVQKTRFYTREGEPVYMVTVNPVIKVKKG
jgi:hypothetical protein